MAYKKNTKGYVKSSDTRRRDRASGVTYKKAPSPFKQIMNKIRGR